MTAVAIQTGTLHEERMRLLYRTHANAVFCALLRWTSGDWQAAEDLVQETMLRAWRKLDSLDGDPVTLRPWLLTVARRVAIDAMRARAVRPPEAESDPLDEFDAPAESYDQVLDRQVLVDGLATLSPDHRAALVQVYLLDQTVPQAARSLGVPDGTVKSRLHYALREVRAAFAGAVV